MAKLTSRALLAVAAIVSGFALAGGPAAAIIVAEPVCTAQTGVEYRNIEALPGDLSLYSALDGEGNYLVLAHCAAGSQVMIRPIQAGTGIGEARQQIFEMIRSTETYSFDDIRRTFSEPVYRSAISTTQPDGCICANGN